MSIREVANDLKNKQYALTVPEFEPIERRQGVVADFDGATRTCTVFLAGGDRPVPNIKFMNSYFPRVGDTVWVDIKGYDWIIVGATHLNEWGPYNTVLTGMSPGNHGQIYRREGSNCTVDFNFEWTGTSGIGTVFGFTAPFPAHTTMYEYVGSMHFIRASAGGTHFAGICYIAAGTSTIRFVGPSGIVSGNFGMYRPSEAGFTIAATDRLTCTLNYQVAPGY